MLYREIMAVCSEIHKKHINTLCGQNLQLLIVILVVHIVTTGLQRFSYFAHVIFSTRSNHLTSPYNLNIYSRQPAPFPRSTTPVSTVHSQQECLNMDQYFTAPI